MDLPDWAAWSWREEFLPAPFHTVTGFLEAQALLHQQLKTPEDANHIVLGISLALHDIGQAQEVEADATPPPGLPSWVHTSELDITLVDGLLQCEPLADVG